MKAPRWMIAVAGIALFAGITAGCGPDNPKIVEAPPVTPPANPEPPVIPNRPNYGQSDKYQKAMERQGQATAPH